MNTKRDDEITYRYFGDPGDLSNSGHSVSLCPHLRAELDDHLETAAVTGAFIRLTKAKAAALNIEGLRPMDLSEKEGFRWAEQATKLFFWGRGTRKCETCGHVARGRLAQATAEEKRRWQQMADEQLESETRP